MDIKQELTSLANSYFDTQLNQFDYRGDTAMRGFVLEKITELCKKLADEFEDAETEINDELNYWKDTWFKEQKQREKLGEWLYTRTL